MHMKVLVPGNGTVHPSKHSRVMVHFTGWTTDGRMFDSSVLRDVPVTFAYDRVILGWQEALDVMVVGEKRRLWVPEWLAYKGRREPKGMLVFDFELLRIEEP